MFILLTLMACSPLGLPPDSGVTLYKLRYPLLNPKIELQIFNFITEQKKNRSTSFNEIIMEFLKPSNGCAQHTCTFKMMESTGKEVY